MRLIAILAIGVCVAIYTGFFNMEAMVLDWPLPIISTLLAISGLAYVLARGLR